MNHKNLLFLSCAHIPGRYYSAYGEAAREMRSFWEYWESWTNSTFTSPSVRSRVAELMASPETGSGRTQFIMIPELYTDAVIVPAYAWLHNAMATCGKPTADACMRVAKSRVYLDYLQVLRAAVNATNFARAASKEDSGAGWWTQTVDAAAMVTYGRALRAMGMRIRVLRLLSRFHISCVLNPASQNYVYVWTLLVVRAK